MTCMNNIHKSTRNNRIDGISIKEEEKTMRNNFIKKTTRNNPSIIPWREFKPKECRLEPERMYATKRA